MVISLVYKVLKAKNFVDDTLNWCAKRHTQTHPLIRENSELFFKTTANISFLIIRGCLISMILSQLLIDVAAAIYTFVTGNYELGLPFHILFLKPTSTKTYLINWISQFVAQTQECYFSAYCVSIFVAYSLYMIKQADLINDIIIEVDHLETEDEFQEWKCLVVDKTEDLKS